MKNILFIFILALFSCNTPEKYEVSGVIKEINHSDRKILIDHDEIPGFMVEMVMYFNVHESVDLNSISINDSVTFDLLVNKQNSYTINYNIVGKSSIIEDDFWDEDQDSKYSLKSPSEIFDNVTFTDINNNKIELSSIEENFIVISFIFSKCPMPNMCPAAIVKNQYLSNYFKNESVKFLLISFDYMYDTPEVLKNIYGTINTDNLLFLSSVNHINDIVSLANQSGLAFWGVEENNIGHTMRTLLLDKKLRLIKTFDGDNWKAAEVKESIENLLKFYN